MDRLRIMARSAPLASDEAGDARMGGTVDERVAAVAALTLEAFGCEVPELLAPLVCDDDCAIAQACHTYDGGARSRAPAVTRPDPDKWIRVEFPHDFGSV